MAKQSTTKRAGKTTKPAAVKPTYVFGERKNKARAIYRAKGMDRGTFIARVVAVGATVGTARAWWQQFRTGASPVKPTA